MTAPTDRAGGLVRNCWYVIAERSELDSGPLARRVLGEDIVLLRTTSGAVHALFDRCPHRFTPLSKGSIEGESLRCIYHGAAFDGQGRCTGMPGLERIPERLRVRSYPVVERFGWIWIWPGEAAAADPALLPGNAWFGDNDDPVWRSGWNCFRSLPVAYQLIGDNLMDVTHAQCVHPDSFGFPVAGLARGMLEHDGPLRDHVTYRVDGGRRHIALWLALTGPLTPSYFHETLERRHGRRPEGDLDFVMHVEWYAPGTFSYLLRIAPAGRFDDEALSMCYLHFLTPESATSTHYFYRVCHDSGKDTLTPWLLEGADFIFSQDKAVLEAQQYAIGHGDLWDAAERPVILPGDQLVTQARAIIGRMCGAEA